MKCTIPEISWHNRDPVLSIDIQPKGRNDKIEFYRLASGGTDSHVLIWHMSLNEAGLVNLDIAADLTRHQRAVNAVKWSPNGELLASGDDESVIFIWKQKGESEIVNIVDTTNEQDKEIWLTLKILRGHMEDVYDLSWSPNSLFLASGSVDNTAMIWDVSKGKAVAILNDHKGFVQGVAWDPQNQYVATLSTDRYMRIFDIQTKKTLNRISKCTLPVPPDNSLFEKSIRLFHDDTLQTFFRRLCFSPDGKLLIVPAGVADFDGVTKPINLTYIFSRYTLKQPAIILPSPDQYTVAVNCCPLLFKLRPHSESSPPIIPLPYRMIFAIATKTSVYLYDTQQTMPFGLISNIHYTRLTDLAWSNDGRVLVVSSTDGFCSLITFVEGELGEVYNKDDEVEKNKEGTNETLDQKANSPNTNKTVAGKSPIQTGTKKKARTSSTDARLESTPTVDGNINREVISSVEKFESPEKKNRPATPISVRRHPRSLSTSASQSPVSYCLENTNQTELVQQKTPVSGAKPKTPSSKSTKKTASVIPTRRQPRNLIPNPVEKTIIVEEAIDAWPLDESPPKPKVGNINNTENKSHTIPTSQQLSKADEPNTQHPAVSEQTEDIRLVYEESQDDVNVPTKSEGLKSSSILPNDEKKEEAECKTPRRVPLKTISTPKSIKKSNDG